MQDELKKLADVCLKCSNPSCMQGCILNNNIKDIMNYVSNKDFDKAYIELSKTQTFGEVCGLLCDESSSCMNYCILAKKNKAVNIKRVEYLLSKMFSDETCLKSNRKIAVIGGGISGLTAAKYFAVKGFQVELFEKNSSLGGVLFDIIPEFRYSDFELSDLLRKFVKLGIIIHYNANFGVNLFEKDLSQFAHIFFAFGNQCFRNYLHSKFVISGIDILKQIKSKSFNQSGMKIIVVGLGNVSIDAARSLKRLGNDVQIFYRRDILSSPASVLELQMLEEEGISVLEKLSPVSVIDEDVAIIKFEKMDLISSDTNKKQMIHTNEFIEVRCDMVVEAIGQYSDFFLTDDLKIDRYSLIGDYVLGPTTFKSSIKHTMDICKSVSEKLFNKTCLFGGSFNPLTVAHEEIINYLLTLFDEIILVPNGDNYPKAGLLNYEERVNIIKEVFKDNRVFISDYEQKNGFKGTRKTLDFYEHPVLVIGDDQLFNLSTWIDYKSLVKENRFLVFTRNKEVSEILDFLEKDEFLKKYQEKFTVKKLNYQDVSSSNFRNSFDESNVSKKVYSYIINNSLYKKKES